MHRCRCTGPHDGFAGDWHFQHLAKYDVGGAGAVMTETLCVEPRGRNTYGDLGIWLDDHVAPVRRIAGFLKAQGAVPAAALGRALRAPSQCLTIDIGKHRDPNKRKRS